MSVDLFEGVRVVELAQYVFVPAATAVLSDLGADVIKVEPVGTGDPYRYLHTATLGSGPKTYNLRLEHANRGKRSIGVDVKTTAGRGVLEDLIAQADVFATSLRPRALSALDLDDETLRARHPRLVIARGTGYGARGPDANRPGYDATAYWSWGAVGMAVTDPDAATPARQRPAMGDNSAAMSVAFGIAAALLRRTRTGDGGVVDVSLLGSAVWTLAMDVMSVQNPGYQAHEMARPSGWNPLTEVYRTSDGRFLNFVLLQPDRYWPDLCRRLGRSDLIADPRFADAARAVRTRRRLCGDPHGDLPAPYPQGMVRDPAHLRRPLGTDGHRRRSLGGPPGRGRRIPAGSRR